MTRASDRPRDLQHGVIVSSGGELLFRKKPAIPISLSITRLAGSLAGVKIPRVGAAPRFHFRDRAFEHFASRVSGRGAYAAPLPCAFFPREAALAIATNSVIRDPEVARGSATDSGKIRIRLEHPPLA